MKSMIRYETNSASNSSGFSQIALIAIVAVFLIVGFIALVSPKLNNFSGNQSTEKTELETAFNNYSKAVGEVIENFYDQSSGDYSARERREKKDLGNVIEARKVRAELEKSIKGASGDLKDKLEDYIELSDKVLSFQEENLELWLQYNEPGTKNENLNIEISSTEEIRLSDPDRYASELLVIITKLEGIIQDFEDMDYASELRKHHLSHLEDYRNRLEYLEDRRVAVAGRDFALIAEIEKRYAEKNLAHSKVHNEIEDAEKKKVEDWERELKKLNRDIKDLF